MLAISPSEQAVLKRLAQGDNSAEVAKALNKARKTVEGHMARLCDRMRVADRQQLAIAAEQIYGGSSDITKPPKIDLSNLTDRELEYLALACDGLSYKEIATSLGVKHRSVWPKIREIKSKVGVERLGVLRSAAREALRR